MSTTPTKRPPESSRTPEDTPSVIARSIAQLACAPPESVGAFINDDDRDAAYQRLVTRLTADEPDAWSRAREDDVEERLGESLSTGEDVTLFHQYSDHCVTNGSIREEAAFLVGVEIGRLSGRPETGTTVAPVSTESTNDHPSVDDVILKAVSALWLAKCVVDNQLGDVAETHSDAWFALGDLLKAAATNLDEARGRYCTESNALAKAARRGCSMTRTRGADDAPRGHDHPGVPSSEGRGRAARHLAPCWG